MATGGPVAEAGGGEGARSERDKGSAGPVQRPPRSRPCLSSEFPAPLSAPVRTSLLGTGLSGPCLPLLPPLFPPSSGPQKTSVQGQGCDPAGWDQGLGACSPGSLLPAREWGTRLPGRLGSRRQPSAALTKDPSTARE